MSASSCDGFVYCTDRELERREPELTAFGIRDARGRAIGYRVERSTIEHVERDAGPDVYRICKPADLGVWFEARTITTRDGARFGASQSTLRARTETELEELIAARVAGARARYAAAAARTTAGGAS